MPQISKIRIVNFRYDGNRFIPDELYDLTSPETGEALNSLFNLNNGGGKTVLVQLMMQPVNPKAMAGGRHIEDYFTRPGDHSFILLEWNLDGSRDKLLTGIAIAAGAGTSSDDEQRESRIRYYTFRTTYEGSSPYDIAALELSSSRNGKYYPADFDYVKAQAKASKGALEYYSSEDSAKWANMLSEEYDIHRTEWETVIETLNKDEGGLNQYFDDAKTSDKLIAKFFIPAIEQKLTGTAPKRRDSTLETMLINYAKKITDKETVILERDINNKLLDELGLINDMVGKLYSANDDLTVSVSEAYGFLAALSKRIAAIDSDIADIDAETAQKNDLVTHIRYEESSANYYKAEERHKKAKDDFEVVGRLLEECGTNLGRKKHEADILRCADLYIQIQSAAARSEEIRKLITDKENNSEDAERIASLKYSVLVRAKKNGMSLTNKGAELEARIVSEKEALKKISELKKQTEIEAGKARDKYFRAESEFSTAKSNTDKRLCSLGIDAIRKFDGFYSADEINDERSKKTKRKEQLDADIRETNGIIERSEKRKNDIPGEKADIRIKHNSVSEKLDKARTEIKEYDSLLGELIQLCGKYSLTNKAAFSGVLKDNIRKEIDITEAEIVSAENKAQALREKRNAAEKGHLHILPEIMRYIGSTGVSCMTGEEYICGLLADGSLPKDKADKIISEYPELVYSLLFHTQKNMDSILSAGNTDWLPAVVPLFTMEQVARIIDGSMERSAFLSACDRSYLNDKNGYVRHLDNELAQVSDKTARLRERLAQAKEDRGLAERFNYSEVWRVRQDRLILSCEQELSELGDALCALDKEHRQLEADLSAHRRQLETLKEELRDIGAWLGSFAELEGMISDEFERYNELQNAYREQKTAGEAHRKVCEEYDSGSDRLSALNARLKENNDSLNRTKDILSKVANAKEAAVIDNELEILFSQYNSLLNNMNESIEGSRNNLQAEQDKMHKAEEELGTYNVNAEEYKTAVCSPGHLYRIRSECDALEREKDSLQSDYNRKNSEHSSASESLRQARELLGGHDGIPLPKEEIGDSFRARIMAAEGEIKSLDLKNDELTNEKRSLERLTDQVSDKLNESGSGSVSRNVVLSDDPAGQWKSISESLTTRRKLYDDKLKKLYEKLHDTVSDYKESALAEIIGKLDSVKDMIGDTELKGDRLFTVGESIEAMIGSIRKINSRIETDLRELGNDLNDIVDQCFIQGKRTYTDLRMIAGSSKAHIYEGKPQIQMVRMDLPEENEISEEASRVSVMNEIEQGANELRELLKSGSEDKQILKRAKAIVSSERLLHKYIRKESVSVKVYKIDINSANSSYKRWEDTPTQSSGAEKFVAFFAVVLTLMNYTRASAGFINRDAKSVLILDNPFGSITSAHLLKPMFDIAKRFNVQLICLSDINKSDVISCFDCVIKLKIKMQALSNYEIMTHEGNELIEHGYYKIMNGQLNLF